MDVLIDTHLCLVCQTTLIGLENYVIHKRNACAASGTQKPPAVSKIGGVLGGPSCSGAMLGSHDYQHDEAHTESGTHYNGHSLQTQSSHTQSSGMESGGHYSGNGLQTQSSHRQSNGGESRDHYGSHGLQAQSSHAQNSSGESGSHYSGNGLQTQSSHTQGNSGESGDHYSVHSLQTQSSRTQGTSGENGNHYSGNNLQAQPSHIQGTNGPYPLQTSRSGSVPELEQPTVLSMTADQGRATYLHHSGSHLDLDNASHSLSSLIGVHQSTDHYHSGSQHELDHLSNLESTSHTMDTGLTSSSGQKLPSIRSFRSCARLLPAISREPDMESSAESLQPSLPFSHLFQGNRENLGASDHLDVHTSHSLPSSLGLGLTTTQYTPTALTSPYTTTPHTSIALTSTNSHDILSQSTSQVAGLEVAVASLVSTFSPPSRVVDHNMVLYDTLTDKDTNFTDFFSSLELQYRVDVKASPTNDADLHRVGVDGRSDIDHNKALHIANIINELAFSSDSDNILPSDTENLLDSSEDEGGNAMGMAPPTSHTGGKWVPSQKLATPRHDTTTVSIPSKWNSFGKGVASPSRPVLSAGKQSSIATKMNSGKMRTGLGKGKAMGGKLRPDDDALQNDYSDESDAEDKGEITNDENHELDEESPQRPEKGKYVSRGKVFPPGKIMAADKTYQCRPCKRKLSNKISYERHCSTAPHLKRAKNQDEIAVKGNRGKDLGEKKVAVENLECTVCSKKFDNRYNFARHLVSGYHQHKAVMDSKGMLLDEPFQLLLSRQSRYQCRICKFYCNTSEQLKVHILSEGHAHSMRSLAGPLLCVRCRFTSHDNTEMLDHVAGEQHGKMIESDKPCVLRETRYPAQCQSSDNAVDSVPLLKKHNETVHCGQLDSTKRKVTKEKIRFGKGSHVCPHCLTKWSTLVSMDRHIRTEHDLKKPYRCVECNRSYGKRSGLNAHCQSKKHLDMLVQLGDVRPLDASSQPKKKKFRKVTHKCKMCDFVAEKYSDLRPHFLQAHIDSVLECTTCGVQFVSLPAFYSHMKSKQHVRMEEEARGSVTTFTCNICGKKSYNSKKFILHKLVHRYIIQNNEMESVRQVRMALKGIGSKYKDFLSSIESVTPGQRVTCPLCKRSITKQQIFTHLRIHDGVSPFGCIYCTTTFACPKSLQRHLAGHLGIKCLKCGVCNKMFSREKAFMNHMKTEHVDGKNKNKFTCATCGKSVSHKWKLRLHMLAHNKPVRCKEVSCLIRFRCESQMLSHYNVHTGLKPHLCDECGYAAKTKQHLNRHHRTHTGERKYQCEYCEYRALNSTNLGRHMRIHIGTKPFKCPYCSLTCNTLENIRKHVMKTKKHAGKLVYLCKVCNLYGTNSASEFKQHLIQLHDVSESGIDIVSEYAGLYNKTEDVKTVAEGARVIPSKDHQSVLPGCKRKRRKGTMNDQSLEKLPHRKPEEHKVKDEIKEWKHIKLK